MEFHAGELELQQRASVRAIADENSAATADFVFDRARDFLEQRQIAVLGTVDGRGRPWASVVVGEFGFITVPSPHMLRIGSLPATGDPLLNNLARKSHVALLAIDFVNPRRVRVNGKGIIRDGAIYITTEQVYGNCRRYIQEWMFTGARRASTGDDRVIRSSALSDAQNKQISSADTFLIASDHPDSGADVSHKGGGPGFVKVINARHLSFPDYNGNSMFNTLGNVAVNPSLGLLFINFTTGRTLQLGGLGSIDWSPERSSAFSGAERVVDFEIEEIIDNPAGFPLLAGFCRASRYNPKAEPVRRLHQ